MSPAKFASKCLKLNCLNQLEYRLSKIPLYDYCITPYNVHILDHELFQVHFHFVSFAWGVLHLDASSKFKKCLVFLFIIELT